MSVGGTFTLINNNSTLDKLLLQTENFLKTLSATKDKIQKQNPGTYSPFLSELDKSYTVPVYSHFKPFIAASSEYAKIPVSEGTPSFGSTIRFQLTKFGEFMTDAVLHLKVSSLQALSAQDKVRWASFIGHKICKRFSFDCDNVSISEYDTHVLNWYYENKVSLDKKSSWERCVGQEIPDLAFLTPDPTVDEFREYKWIGSGNQTFKRKHNEIDLFVPLIFWFNEPRNALPSIKLPIGKTYITVDLAPLNELVSYADYGGGGTYNNPTIKACNLYMKNIFIMPELYDIFIKNAGLSVIRIYKTFNKRLTKSSNRELMYSLKFPMESMSVAFRPTANVLNSQNWNVYAKISTQNIPYPVITGNTLAITSTYAVLSKQSPVVDSLELLVKEIKLYNETPAAFSSSYLPLLGKQAQEKQNWHRFHFNLCPDKKQISGYYNVSAGREFYVRYEAQSSNISESTPAEMVVIAETLNILILRNGSAVLRFT
jgi:hypothetical protein